MTLAAEPLKLVRITFRTVGFGRAVAALFALGELLAEGLQNLGEAPTGRHLSPLDHVLSVALPAPSLTNTSSRPALTARAQLQVFLQLLFHEEHFRDVVDSPGLARSTTSGN